MKPKSVGSHIFVQSDWIHRQRFSHCSRMENINSELPSEIIQVIFSKLPFIKLPSCRLVCKAWNKLVLTCKFDPAISIPILFFAHISPYRNLHCVDFDPKHLEGMSSVASFSFRPDFSDYTRISIINSCNELLSLLIWEIRTRPTAPVVCILNPMTNENIKLPTPKLDRSVRYCYGLGFSPKTKQYKIARTSFVSDRCGTSVEIFRFGTSREWTPVGFLPCFASQNHGVYFNGGLYWVGDQLIPYIAAGAMYRLDIEDEKLEKIPSPQDGGCFPFIGVINGSLYLTFCRIEYHVWKMEQDCSWVKAFVFVLPIKNAHRPESYHFQPIKVCEDGKILCLCEGLDLILYDPKTERTEVLTDQDVEIKKNMWVHKIDSCNFNSLRNIFAGKC